MFSMAINGSQGALRSRRFILSLMELEMKSKQLIYALVNLFGNVSAYGYALYTLLLEGAYNIN